MRVCYTFSEAELVKASSQKLILTIDCTQKT